MNRLPDQLSCDTARKQLRRRIARDGPASGKRSEHQSCIGNRNIFEVLLARLKRPHDRLERLRVARLITRSDCGDCVSYIDRETLSPLRHQALGEGGRRIIVLQDELGDTRCIAPDRRSSRRGTALERPPRVLSTAVPVSSHNAKLDGSDHPAPAVGRCADVALSIARSRLEQPAFRLVTMAGHQLREPGTECGVGNSSQLALARVRIIRQASEPVGVAAGLALAMFAPFHLVASLATKSTRTGSCRYFGVQLESGGGRAFQRRASELATPRGVDTMTPGQPKTSLSWQFKTVQSMKPGESKVPGHSFIGGQQIRCCDKSQITWMALAKSADASEKPAGLGDAASRRGLPHEAISYFERAVDESGGDAARVPAIGECFGRPYGVLWRTPEPIVIFRRCLDEQRAAGDATRLVRFTCLLGSAVADNAELSEAEAVVAGALENAGGITGTCTRARLYWSQARLLGERGTKMPRARAPSLCE